MDGIAMQQAGGNYYYRSYADNDDRRRLYMHCTVTAMVTVLELRLPLCDARLMVYATSVLPYSCGFGRKLELFLFNLIYVPYHDAKGIYNSAALDCRLRGASRQLRGYTASRLPRAWPVRAKK